MRRFGTVIKLKPEYLEQYKKYHAAVWPEIIELGKQGNILAQPLVLLHYLLVIMTTLRGIDYGKRLAV